jgi:protein TonB
VTREPSSEEPVDLTADAFVTGRAEAYAGGVSSGLGTSKRAVPALPTAAAPSPAPARGLNLSQPVTLEAERWNCPWPKEADAEDIAEQTAVLRVWVRADGTVESVQTLSDPGHGFGAAALTCAEHTRFNPARDRSGRPVRAQSPPIRVRFTR